MVGIPKEVGGEEGNKKDWMWLTVFPTTPYSVTVKCMKKTTSSCKHLAPDVVFRNSAEIVES